MLQQGENKRAVYFPLLILYRFELFPVQVSPLYECRCLQTSDAGVGDLGADLEQPRHLLRVRDRRGVVSADGCDKVQPEVGPTFLPSLIWAGCETVKP